jgi:uncharacterized protein (TIGR03067 family)
MNVLALACMGVLVTSVVVLSEEPGKKEDTKSEIKKFQGMWAAIKYVQDGEGEREEIAPEESPIRWVFKDNNISMLTDVEEAIVKGTLKLNVKNEPKTIDLVFPAASEDEKDQRILGIYSFDKDTLRICYGMEDEKRPDEFKSEKDSKRILIVFKRLKE